MPVALAYLATRFWRLHRMREIDAMAGPRPFTVDLLERAMRVFGWHLEPIEMEALLVLDAAALNPGDEA